MSSFFLLEIEGSFSFNKPGNQTHSLYHSATPSTPSRDISFSYISHFKIATFLCMEDIGLGLVVLVYIAFMWSSKDNPWKFFFFFLQVVRFGSKRLYL